MKFVMVCNPHLIPLLCALIIMSTCVCIMNAAAPRVRCETPDMIPNGSYRLRRNNMIMRVSCNIGFQLQGYRLISCIRGKWYEEKPVCAKKGCTEAVEAPENGRIHVVNDLKVILYCLDDYTLAGNRFTFCNGTNWDRPIGHCRIRKNAVQHFCDFETDDGCGWVYEPREGLEWKRVMAARVFKSFRTGPRYDHTTQTANGGHYMLMESLTRQSTLVTLTSPIYERDLTLKTACCFQFYYFMYGSGVGTLYVLVKPISISISEIFRRRTDLIKFQKNGNQNNLWNEAHFNIEELNEDFQIVFVAKGGLGHLSDIAIDDVHLMTGQQCRNLDDNSEGDYTTLAEYGTTTEPYESIYDTQSCVGRCNDNNINKGLMYVLNHLVGLCGCIPECEELDSCCPDFRSVCLNDMESSSTETIPIITRPEIMSDEDIPSIMEHTVTPSISTATYELSPDLFISSTTTTTTTAPVKNTTLATTSPTTTTTTTKLLPKKTSIMKTTTTTTTTTTTKKPGTKRIPITTPITTKLIAFNTTTQKSTIKATTTPIITAIAPIKIRKTTTATKITTHIYPIRMVTATITRNTTSKRIEPTTTTTASTTTTTTTTTTTKITTSIPHLTTYTVSSPVNNTVGVTVKKSKKTTFIVKPEDQVYPDDFHHHSTSIYYIFLVVVLMIFIVLAYRTYGNQAVTWYRIYFHKHESGEEETSSALTGHLIPVTSVEHSTSSSLSSSSKRATKKSIYDKIKLQSRRRSQGKSEMKRPLWRDDQDDYDDDGDGDGDEDDRNMNGNIVLGNKLFTEL